MFLFLAPVMWRTLQIERPLCFLGNGGAGHTKTGDLPTISSVEFVVLYSPVPIVAKRNLPPQNSPFVITVGCDFQPTLVSVSV
jgi:hypothetical protein